MRVTMSSSPLSLPISQTHHHKYSVSILPTTASPPQLSQQMPCTSNDTHYIDHNSSPKAKTIRFRLSELCRKGQLHLARQLFDAIPQPTTVLWNTLIIGYVCNNMPYEAISLYSRCIYSINSSDDRKCDAYTYSSVLKACAETKQLLIGKAVHCHVLRSSDCFNSLLNMYATCLLSSGCDLVNKVFSTMRKRNVVSWNTMIAWCAKTGRFVEAVRHLVMMMKMGFRPTVEDFRQLFGEECTCLEHYDWGYVQNNCPIAALELFNEALEAQDDDNIDEVTFLSALTAASELQQLDIAQQLHSYLIKNSLVSSVILLNAVVALYSRCNSIGDSFTVFSGMQERDVVSWNTMICALVQNGLDDEGLMLVYEMQKMGFSVDDVTITAILSAASNLRNQEIGKQTHVYLIRHGIQFNGMDSYLIDMYAKSGLVSAAETIFNRNCKGNSDLAVWNAMISGNTQNGLVEQSLIIFQQMLEENVMPNAVTLASILPACSQLGSIALGKLLHGIAIRNFLDKNVFVSSALVDMYSKSGAIVYAERAFAKSAEKNSVTYTNMILGYGQHGMGEKAIVLFSSMRECGINPDAITFVAVLSACSYTGLINEGLEIFESMESEYGIKPSTEHYACVVDMLGRVGRVVEAYEFARKLGKEGNVLGIWGSLLSACKIHQDFELGKIVANKLLEMEGTDRITGYHVLLSNIHAEEGNWEYVKSVRKEMVERGLTKEVGCSWIDISGYANCFVSRDRKHPQCAEIYQLLKHLSANMKDAGYTPPFLSSEC
ncbi:hypothetical protein DH2020_028332 [Rehmannia glutinosa]|uniref:Pentatricopeptide repeat-containing protein n=1 Tax=Rehmannia glutinosa TaxID=99300 RepID=A0ABR0VSM7_REHGL